MSLPLKTLDYVLVYVSDMKRSLNFYQDVLGLPVHSATPHQIEFDTGTTKLVLHRTPGGDVAPSHDARPPAGVGQIVFLVDNLQQSYEFLRAKGVIFSQIPQLQPSGVKLAVFHDPDGFGINLQQR